MFNYLPHSSPLTFQLKQFVEQQSYHGAKLVRPRLLRINPQ